jgi:hypothetical protein
MWKQAYYPPFEESDYEGAQDNWRIRYFTLVTCTIAGLALLFYVIDVNDGFNHGFGVPAKALKTTSLLTNASTLLPAISQGQGFMEVNGFDLTSETVINPVVKKKTQHVRLTQDVPIITKETEPKPTPEPEEPVTAPRISQ